MKVLGVYDAKTRLSQLIEEVLAGEEVIISRNGRKQVRLVPFTDEATDPVQAVEAMKAFRRRSLDGTTIKELITEGRR